MPIVLEKSQYDGYYICDVCLNKELFNLNDVVTNAIDDIMINKVLVKVKLAACRFDTPK
jgi:hypothetical protein